MTILITALILGLTSSLHCIGMCGPIALAIPLNRSSQLSMILGILAYNSGRVLTYGVLGAIVGILGLSLSTFGILQWISILAGIGLVLFAWKKYLIRIHFPALPNLKMYSWIQSAFGKLMKSRSKLKLFLLGSLNGLLPCGMVYIALLNAILAGSPVNSGLAMMLFGAATIPVMFVLSFAFNKISVQNRMTFNRFVPYAMTVVGLLVILRGMNLGIPYISPKIAVVTSTKDNCTQNQQNLNMECCHK